MTVTVVTDAGTFMTAPEPPIIRTAVFIARVVDEVSGAEPRTAIDVRTNREVAFARAGTGGMISVSGRVEHLFPDLATTNYQLDLTITARGYRTHTRTETILAGSLFPIDLGTIALRPFPVRVEGRVTKEADRTPISGAEIGVITPKVLLLSEPAYYDHPIGTAVTVQTLTTGVAHTLVSDAPAGTLTFALSGVGTLGPGDLLLFGGREYGVIASVDATPKTVTLEHALRRSYADGDTVHEVNIAGGAATTTSRDVNAGDGILLLNASLTGTGVSIGGAPIEYHALGVVSDAEGFYAANGVGGLREPTFRASAGGFADLDVPLVIDYANPVNPSSFRLRP